MKNNDRFKNYEADVRRLVLDFEAMCKSGEDRYFDVAELEIIIDFYLDNSDVEMIEKSVVYAERLFPASNEVRLRRAHLLCFKERYEEALKILTQIERTNPDDTDVFYALGVVYSAVGQSRKAIQYYRKAAADGYELGIIYSNIADEYVGMGCYAEARKYYRKALSVKPDDEHSLFELANAYEDEGLTDKWVEYFAKYVEDHPYSCAAWYCLGDGYCAEQLYERAIDAYKYAIAIDEGCFDAYIQAAGCYASMGDSANAVSMLHDALEHTDDKAFVYFRIGEIFRGVGNNDTAAVYYRKAVGEDPFYAEAWHSMAFSYYALQSMDSAIDAGRRAVNIDPESPIYMTTLALLYADNGKVDEAEEMFKCAEGYYADFERGWLAYADFLITLERYDEAIDVLSAVLPGCELVKDFNKRLAFCYLRRGKRNMLYNAVRACIYYDDNGESELLEYCPELRNDYMVMDIIMSHRREKESEQENKQ